MAVPRDDATFGQRLKVLEQEFARLKLQASQTVAPTQPTAVMASSTWIDSSANNAPYYYDGTDWIPVRDGNIAVAQGTADTAAADAATAQADADAATAAAAALQIELDAAEVDVAAAQADIATLNTTTLPALQTDLDAAQASLVTAQGDITAVQAAVVAAQADVDAILPITETDISDDAITTPKIATGAITAVKIAANTITAAEIAADAITASELAANAVTAGKIAAGTIVAGDISAGAITTVKIATDAVTANEIAAATITATELAAGAVTTTKLAADAIDGKTITGALVRTAATGERVEISTGFLGGVRFFSGHASEASSGFVSAGTSGTIARLVAQAPAMTGVAQANLLLSSDAFTGESEAVLDGGDVLTLTANKGLGMGGGVTGIGMTGPVMIDSVLVPLRPQCLSAAATANADLANSVEVDVTGATITFTTARPNATFMCTGSFYFAMIQASNAVALGKLSVDGTVQSAFANFTGLFSTPERVNASQTWVGTLAAAGSHTLKLRGVGPGVSGTPTTAAHRINATHTTITVLVFE